jgi:hypothetical protein
MANKYVKKCSTFLAVKEMQIKITLRLYLTPVKIATIKNTNYNKCWGGCKEKVTLMHCWWECKLVQPLQKVVWNFKKKKKNKNNKKKNYHTIQQYCSWVYTQRNVSHDTKQRHLHTHVYYSPIHNSQAVEMAQMPNK